MEFIPVNKIIENGKRKLVYTPVAIFLFFVIGMFLFLVTTSETQWWHVVGALTSLVSAILAPFFYYFRVLAAWRIWAYNSAQNVHELDELIVLCRLTPKNKSRWWRFGQKTPEQQLQLAAIDAKLMEPEVFIDDFTILEQSDYRYGGFPIVFMLTAGAVLLLSAISEFMDGSVLVGAVSLVLSTVISVTAILRKLTTEPALTLSNTGKYSRQHGWHPWTEISDERIYYIKAGKELRYELSWMAGGALYELPLNGITGPASWRLLHTLRTYRGRYQATLAKKPTAHH